MIKVLIVDDSAVVRKVLTDELSKYADIEIVGTAVDPYSARNKIVKLKPDVVTLDMEMPRMDGLSFLAKLMKHYPLPVVVLSSLTPKNSEIALKAMEFGVVDVLCKPGAAYSTKDISKALVRSIRGASIAKVKKYDDGSSRVKKVGHSELLTQTTHKVLAIGASTGGTQAITDLLQGMPATLPGTVIVQHMPADFTTSFAERLNEVCDMEVREARDNDRVVPGVVLVAPGNFHMLLNRSGGIYMVKIKNGPMVHYQRPAVDVLFRSVAENAGKNAVGIVLTGMGADGAKGLLEMRKKGAYTFVQDEKTSVVFGMPKEAIKLGAADEIVPLHGMPQAVVNALNRKRLRKKSNQPSN